MEGFLLDRIDAESTRSTIGGEHHFITPAGAHKTQPLLTVAQSAESRTQIALQSCVVDSVPVPRRMGGDLGQNGLAPSSMLG